MYNLRLDFSSVLVSNWVTCR